MILCNLLSGAVSALWLLVVSTSDSVFSAVVAVRSVRDSVLSTMVTWRVVSVFSPVVAVLGP